MDRKLVFALSCCFAAAALAAGPTETDPDKYKLILENDRVRVLRYHDEPGAKTKLHHHDAFVLYVLAPFKRRLSFPDGTKKEREFKTGDVIFMEAQDHVGENVGKTPTEALIVELKQGASSGPAIPPDAGWQGVTK